MKLSKFWSVNAEESNQCRTAFSETNDLTRSFVDVVDGADAEEQDQFLQADVGVIEAHSLLLAVDRHSIDELLDGFDFHFRQQMIEDVGHRTKDVLRLIEDDVASVSRLRELEDFSFNERSVSVIVSDDVAQKSEVLVQNEDGIGSTSRSGSKTVQRKWR